MKFVAIIHWAARFCPDAEFVLEIEDVKMLNVWSFTSTLGKLERETVKQNTIWEFPIEETVPIMNLVIKCHVPLSRYTNNSYPDFLCGRV